VCLVLVWGGAPGPALATANPTSTTSSSADHVPAVVAPCDSLSPNQRWLLDGQLTVNLFGDTYCLAVNDTTPGPGPGQVAAFTPCTPDLRAGWARGPDDTLTLMGTSLCLASDQAPGRETPVQAAMCGEPGTTQRVS
jgi:hypothetical protein